MRERAIFYKDNGFTTEHYYLVVDGDWQVESKINLYEAGFSDIFEITELEHLADELRAQRSEGNGSDNISHMP